MNALTRILSELNEDQLKELYMRVFNNDDGRLVLEDLRNRCFSYMPTTTGAKDVNDILLNEGSRRVVLNIETQLEPKPTEIKKEEE